MRITLDLDDEVVAAAIKLSPGKTLAVVVTEALEEYARRRSLARFRDLRGKFRWEGNLDDLRGRTAPKPTPP